jgi:hypothetical protein
MKLRHSTCIIPLLLLAACGGGGGDGSSQATAVVITSTNAKAVSADALDASTNLGAAGDPGVVLGVQVQGTAASNPTALAWLAPRLLAMAPARAAAVATGVAVNETVACDSGSLNISGDVSGGQALVAGDILTFTASSCVTDGTRLNGSMTIRITRGPYDPQTMGYPRGVTMTITARNLRLTQGGVTVESTGAMELALDEASATSSQAVVTIDVLTNKVGGRTSTVKDYTRTATVSGAVTAIDVSGTVETQNTRLGSGTKRYAIDTIVPLAMNAGAFTGGTLEVVGANAAALRLVVSGTDTFTIQMDLDGNGSFESSTTATRAELDALL